MNDRTLGPGDVHSLLVLLQLSSEERDAARHLRKAATRLKAALREAPPPVLAMLADEGAPAHVVLARLDDLLQQLPADV